MFLLRLSALVLVPLWCCAPAATPQAGPLAPLEQGTVLGHGTGGQTQSATTATPIGPLNLPLESKGDLLMARGAYEEALQTFERVEPRSPVVWNKIGIAYHHLFAMDQALSHYKMAVALDSHYGEAYNNIGAACYAKHDYSASEKAYKRALKYQPHMAGTYMNLGTLYFAQAKYKKGVRAYQQALALDTDIFTRNRRQTVEEPASLEQRMKTNFYMAELLASAGKKTEALDALAKALAEGFSDRKRLMEDKELASIREMPEFHKLLVAGHLE